MKKTKHILLIFILQCASSFCFGQDSTIDSLIRVIKNKNNHDTNKLNAMGQLAYNLRLSQKTDSAILIANEEVELANSLQNINTKKWIGKSYFLIGNCQMDYKNYSKGFEYHLKAIDIFEAMGDKKMMGKSYLKLAIFSNMQEDSKKAEKYCIKAIQLFIEIGDKKLEADGLSNLAETYMRERLYEKSISIFEKNLKLYNELNEPINIANTYENLSVVYHDQKMYIKAYEYTKLSLSMMKRLHNENGLFTAYSLLGKHSIELSKPKLAIAYIDSANNIDAKMKNEISYMQFNYETLSLANEQLGNYKEAYHFYKLHKHYKDSSDNEVNQAEISKISNQFQKEKLQIEQEKKMSFRKKKIKSNASLFMLLVLVYC